MSLNLLAIQDDIVEKLKELPQSVYETSAPEDSKLKFDSNNNLLPYIVVEFTDMYDGADMGGILSTRYDVKRSTILVSCVAPTQRAARQVAGAVRDKLLGFKPADAGELRISIGGAAYTLNEYKPARYVSELAFEFPVNTVW